MNLALKTPCNSHFGNLSTYICIFAHYAYDVVWGSTSQYTIHQAVAEYIQILYTIYFLQVSILSLAIEGSANLTALRSLRTLRALRPLRAISRWQGMKVGIDLEIGSMRCDDAGKIVCWMHFIIVYMRT